MYSQCRRSKKFPYPEDHCFWNSFTKLKSVSQFEFQFRKLDGRARLGFPHRHPFQEEERKKEKEDEVKKEANGYQTF